MENTEERNISNEAFERKNRLNFKTSKCKLLVTNGSKQIDLYIDGERLEVVDDHVYLGTIVSSNGLRVNDMLDRIKKSKSVANEIVQICKEPELLQVSLWYVKMLMSACLDSKVKYGCALWNLMNHNKAVEEVNRMKPNVIKRVI